MVKILKVVVLSAGLLAVGCSQNPSPDAAAMTRTGGTHPHWAALYVSPELDAAKATITRDGGAATELEVGEYLRAELVRATGRAFRGVQTIDEPRYTGEVRTPHRAPDIWPRQAAEELPSPDLIVAVFPADLSGHLIPGGSCDTCEDKLSVRVEMIFELLTLDGEVFQAGRVAGKGLGVSEPGSEDAPLSALFRGAVADAIDEMAEQYRMGLASCDVDLPAEPAPGRHEDRQEFAERPDDEVDG